MNCSNCIKSCEAKCCGVVPLPDSVWEKHTPVREVIKKFDMGNGYTVGMTKDAYCPFLSKDFRCTIYEDRPEVCKKFGDETEILMTCSYQAKDGRIRSRQERRALYSVAEKEVNKRMKINKTLFNER